MDDGITWFILWTRPNFQTVCEGFFQCLNKNENIDHWQKKTEYTVWKLCLPQRCISDLSVNDTEWAFNNNLCVSEIFTFHFQFSSPALCGKQKHFSLIYSIFFLNDKTSDTEHGIKTFEYSFPSFRLEPIVLKPTKESSASTSSPWHRLMR